MSYHQPEHGRSDSLAETPGRKPYPPIGGSQKLQSQRKYRYHHNRSSSAERPSDPRSEDGQSGFDLTFGLGNYLSVGFGSGDRDRKVRELEDQVRQVRENGWQMEQDFRRKLEERDCKLDQKEAELEELKKTLRLYNDCSEVDIGNMVGKINAKVQSLSIDTGVGWLQTLGESSYDAGDGMEAVNEGLDQIKSLVGIQFVNALCDAARTPEQYKFAVDTLLPLAWQACITATVAKILSSFSASLAGISDDTVLKRIADGVMRGEAQPAYGRWRLVTHQYLRRLLSNDEQTAIQAYVDEALVNCRIACRQVMRKNCPNDQDFAAAFQTQLYDITEVAFGLLNMIQEKMITANFEPYTPLNGEPFDPRSMIMDQQDKPFPNDFVACTTGLGLRWWRKEGRESTSEMSPKTIFKKAEVFTEGNLRDLVGN